VALELFIEKKFSAAHKQVIRQANKIIEEYKAIGYTLTLRGIHYQFVARDLYDNTPQNYKRLGNILDAARKAGQVPWDGIEDQTRNLKRISVWNTPESAVERLMETFKLDPWDEQPIKRRIEVWVEKDAAVTSVRKTCDDLRLPYFSCRGYSSSSGLYEAGKRLEWYQRQGYETLILYLGDHDPSGLQMTDVARERVCLYSRCEVEFKRIALTMEQIREYNPPEQFAKESDSRTPWYIDQVGTEDAWELDALSPQIVDELLRSEVEPLIDRKAWDKTMATEADHIATLEAITHDWERTKMAPRMLEFIESISEETVAPEIQEGLYEPANTETLTRMIDGADEILREYAPDVE
jgi:hypothetical protein